MSEPELLRIRQIRVEGLFGLYNHCIDLNMDERVTVLHGPNGVGKTVLLRMLKAFFDDPFAIYDRGQDMKIRYNILIRTPFDKFEFLFVDGRKLCIFAKKNDGIGLYQHLRFCLLSKDKENIKEAALIVGEREPEWLYDLRQRFGFYLIETQRLFRNIADDKSVKYDYSIEERINLLEAELNEFSNRFFGVPTYHVSGGFDSSDRLGDLPKGYVMATVAEYSEDLKVNIRKAIECYGQKSQALDQSFPQRLLNFEGDVFNSSDLKRRMGDLMAKREEFKRINILDEAESYSFDLSRLDGLDDTKQRVMTLYVMDVEEKFKILDDMAIRIGKLLGILNSKFKNKVIDIDRGKGFVVRLGNGSQLDMECLSSGEQHEFVLYYDLLFCVSPNTLVMIDEPELSLHVMWQRSFLPNLLDIVKLVKFDALIATHSPFIVGDHTDLMVALNAELTDVSA